MNYLEKNIVLVKNVHISHPGKKYILNTCAASNTGTFNIINLINYMIISFCFQVTAVPFINLDKVFFMTIYCQPLKIKGPASIHSDLVL